MFYTFRNQNGLAVVLTKIGYGFWGASLHQLDI